MVTMVKGGKGGDRVDFWAPMCVWYPPQRAQPKVWSRIAEGRVSLGEKHGHRLERAKLRRELRAVCGIGITGAPRLPEELQVRALSDLSDRVCPGLGQADPCQVATWWLDRLGKGTRYSLGSMSAVTCR